MSERFGAGIALDEDLDFSITPTGDLQTEEGTDELLKDLSFQLHFFLQQFLGQSPTEETKVSVLAEVEDVVTRDVRVDSLIADESRVSFFGPRNAGIRVNVALVTSDNESFNFVVEVEQ